MRKRLVEDAIGLSYRISSMGIVSVPSASFVISRR
nr:MAG TPA: hypothetical protein [Caudoviricetes sp.]